jgi:competence ComEA-like helix-hairpin-helix protein
MKTRFLNYLRFTRAERNGTLALMLLAIILFTVPVLTRWFRPQSHTNFSAFIAEVQAFKNASTPYSEGSELFYFDPNTASEQDFVQLGLTENVAKTIVNYRKKGGKFHEPEDFKKIWRLAPEDYERLLPYIRIGQNQAPENAERGTEATEAELFAFDPNTVSEADLFRLGLPSRTVKSILNYRNKGGRFRQKEDLEKIFTLSADDYARLSAYVIFAPVETPLPVATFVAKKQKEAGVLDINRADAEAWKQLPGIGEKRAQQMVGFREKLGGFRSVDQVAELHGLPDSIFQQIRPWLRMDDTPLRTLNLNTASLEALDAHPYISRRQAEMMVAYREQHGAFRAVDDLDNIRAFTDKAWLARVKPYLGVE